MKSLIEELRGLEVKASANNFVCSPCGIIQELGLIISRHQSENEPLGVQQYAEIMEKLTGIGCCPKCGWLIKDINHEPLAVLADRKGKRCIETMPPLENSTILKEWDILIFEGINGVERFFGSTYQEAESQARKYLESLEKVK